MKKYIASIALLLLAAMLSSCAGIGDGAIFDNIKTGESDGAIFDNITTSESDGAKTVCNLVLYNSDKQEILDEVLFEGAEADLLFEYLSSATEPYVEGIEGLSAYNYFVVTFERYDKDGNELPSYDGESGEMNKFYVRDNDNVDRYNMRLSYGRLPLGYLEGAYDRLFGIITEKGSSKGVFGSISTEYAPMAFSRIPTNKAQETYTLLSEGNYVTGLDRTEEVHTYVLLNFTGAVDATYYVYSDDYVAEQSWSSQGDDVYRPLGHLVGYRIYDYCLDLYEESLKQITEAERNEGVRLNRIQVTIEPSISRVFYQSDFEDIGCIYLTRSSNDPHRYTLYFDTCTRKELEEKIDTIVERSYVYSSSLIYIRTKNQAES